MAALVTAQPAVEAKQKPETGRKAAGAGKKAPNAAGVKRAVGAGKSFAAALLAKLAGEPRRPAASVPGPAKAPAGKRPAPENRARTLPHAAALPAAGLPDGAAGPAGKTGPAGTGAEAARRVQAEFRRRPRLVILDLRRATEAKKPRPGAAQAAEGKLLTTGRVATFEVRPAGRPAVSAPADLVLPAVPQPAARPAADASPGAKAPPDLLRAWQEKMVPELVRHTGIIVRDGGEGEIRLVLKPETLGNVRIRISINNNSVEGRIVVENNSVKELFDSSLDNLKASLRQEGFQSASLEVSVGNQRTRQEAEDRRSLPGRLEGRLEEASEEFQRLVPAAGIWAGGEMRVNLVV